MLGNIFSKNKHILLYGASLAVLLLLLKWLEFRFLILDHAIEIYSGAIAILFTLLGIWLALKLIKPRVETVVVEKEVYISNGSPFSINENEIHKLGISKRELEVLQLMAAGLSNQEIGRHLFVSINTIKTHAASLFEKMEVKRRTQAIEKARKMGIIE
jgi:DNA-binding CsgD family transcriptional regulator